MRLEHNSNGLVVLILSKRNVLSLLHKLDMEGSGRTITKLEKKGHDLLMGESPYIEVVVRVEPDADHYLHEDREPQARGKHGAMHPETEEFIAAHRTQCNAVDPGGTCHLPFGHTGNCLMRRDDD